MPSLGLPANLLLFVGAAAVVWWAGVKLTQYVDAIAERRGLERAFLGFLALATATQLPEVVTNSTAALRGDAELVLNSMFGGIGMQTAVLAAADLTAAGYTLTFLARRTLNLLQASILILFLALVSAVGVAGDVMLLPSLGLAPVLLAVLYIAVVRLLWVYQHQETWKPADTVDGEDGAPGHEGPTQRGSVRALVVRSLVACASILASGVVLVRTAETVAVQSGLGQSFVGVTLLASATSLPELSTTLAAVRLGRHSMAIGDIMGSNLIMVALLLPSDLLYRDGLLFDKADSSALFALALGMVVTAIYLVGMILRVPTRRFGLGVDSWAVLGCYVAGLFVLYQLR